METSRTALVAELNDLLALDHDAVQAYDVAIRNLENGSHRETLRQFRGDHERHIEELAALVRTHGGTPVEGSHLSTGVYKLAVQQVGRLAGDHGILLAFEANERQVRDKYWRHADRPHEPAVTAVLRRAAQDEERHYHWVVESLRRLGVGPGSIAGRAAGVLGALHSQAADIAEGAERTLLEQVERARRGARPAADE